jgi:hypothetical protein
LQPTARDEIPYRSPITGKPIAYANGSREPNGTDDAADAESVDDARAPRCLRASIRFLKLMPHVPFNAAIRSHSFSKFAVANVCAYRDGVEET